MPALDVSPNCKKVSGSSSRVKGFLKGDKGRTDPRDDGGGEAALELHHALGSGTAASQSLSTACLAGSKTVETRAVAHTQSSPSPQKQLSSPPHATLEWRAHVPPPAEMKASPKPRPLSRLSPFMPSLRAQSCLSLVPLRGRQCRLLCPLPFCKEIVQGPPSARRNRFRWDAEGQDLTSLRAHAPSPLFAGLSQFLFSCRRGRKAQESRPAQGHSSTQAIVPGSILAAPD